MDRPVTTLFLLCSVDGKITSGDSDALDPARDWKRIHGVREGMPQYYRLEQQTDLCSLITGRVLAKIGVNDRPAPDRKTQLTFIVIDSRPHLTCEGVEYLVKANATVILVTTNPSHPALSLKRPTLHPLLVKAPLDLAFVLSRLKTDFGIERLTVQSGGQMNGAFLRAGLIDRVSIVIAPLLVGGRDTPTVIDGDSIHTVQELSLLRPLRLVSCTQLAHSYLHLAYEAIPVTQLE